MRIAIAIITLLVCLGLVALCLALLPVLRGHSSPPQIDFYGKVIDESGAGIPGAEVSVELLHEKWKIAREDEMKRVTKRLILSTGPDGSFSIHGERGIALSIVAVRKPGYSWVYDHTWILPSTAGPYVDNRYYHYDPKEYPDYPHYVPDLNNPAIFPLHPKGSTVLGMPSRGGTDVYPDGRTVHNKPLRPIIPTTGPGAPDNAAESERMLHDYMARQKQPPRPASQPDVPAQ